MDLSLSFEFEIFKIFNFDSSETVGRIFERIINIHCTCIYPVKRLNCFDDIPIKIKCITFKFLSGGTYLFFNHGHAKSFVLASTCSFRLERHFYFWHSATDAESRCSRVYAARRVEFASTRDVVTKFNPFVTPSLIPYPIQECSNRKSSSPKKYIHVYIVYQAHLNYDGRVSLIDWQPGILCKNFFDWLIQKGSFRLDL